MNSKLKILVASLVAAGIAGEKLGNVSLKAKSSAYKLNSALVNIKQPTKQKVKINKSKKNFNRKLSTKPIKSKAIPVFRNRSNI